MCSRLTLPHDEQRLSAVRSFSPLPAMNRWRFFRYDVFFFGTALRIPSQISDSDGIDGSDNDGMASAPNEADSGAKGCARRCRKGILRAGWAGPLSAGKRVCHSGGSGRVSAMSNGHGEAEGERVMLGVTFGRAGDGVAEQNAPRSELLAPYPSRR